VKRLRAAGAAKVYRETASGARADRPQLHRALAAFTAIARRGRSRFAPREPALPARGSSAAEDGGRRLFYFAMQSRLFAGGGK